MGIPVLARAFMSVLDLWSLEGALYGIPHYAPKTSSFKYKYPKPPAQEGAHAHVPWRTRLPQGAQKAAEGGQPAGSRERGRAVCLTSPDPRSQIGKFPLSRLALRA